MKRFMFKLVLYCTLVTLPYYLIQYSLMKQNDAFYWKSVKKTDHIVLGGSRALKGIFPHLITKELGLESDMLNFAFTGVLSPYGEKYVQAVKRKLKSTTKAGIFILSVSPGGVMDFVETNVPREDAFRFYDLWSMNQEPNVEYVLRHPRKGSALLLEWLKDEDEEDSNTRRVYQDGSSGTYLPEGFKTRKRGVVMRYPMKMSSDREEMLSALIDYLSSRGSVFLVRIPVSLQTLGEEDAMYPSFDNKMLEWCNQKKNTWYINYRDSIPSVPYLFSDGNHHLEGKSAEKFSLVLAKDIKKALQND